MTETGGNYGTTGPFGNGGAATTLGGWQAGFGGIGPTAQKDPVGETATTWMETESNKEKGDVNIQAGTYGFNDTKMLYGGLQEYMFGGGLPRHTKAGTVRMTEKHKGTRKLYDLELVEKFQEAPDRRRGWRWAVLAEQPDHVGLVTLFQHRGQDISMEVELFATEEAAIEWLLRPRPSDD